MILAVGAEEESLTLSIQAWNLGPANRSEILRK